MGGGLSAGRPDSVPSPMSDGAAQEAIRQADGGSSPRRSVDTGGVNIRIEPGVEAPGEARHALDCDELPEELLDDAKLLVSELVTNCIRHARLHPGQWIGVRARPTRDGLRLEVCDPAPGSRRRRPSRTRCTPSAAAACRSSRAWPRAGAPAGPARAAGRSGWSSTAEAVRAGSGPDLPGRARTGCPHARAGSATIAPTHRASPQRSTAPAGVVRGARLSTVIRSPEISEAPQLASDEELVRRVGLGDQRAFEAIYERYREPLYRYCHSIMRQREDAEEAFQATMLSAFQALTAGEEREIALRAWLYRIAHNACISALRKRPRHDAAELTGFEAAREDVGAHTELAEELRQLKRDLGELPDAQRSALVMRELGGLSHVEIGRALGQDISAVKHLIYSARSQLHDLAEGRDLACTSVRRTLSDGDGRALRGRGLRAHLRACAGCRGWQTELHARPARLAALAPVLSAAGFAQIFEAVTGTAAAAGLGAGLAGGAAGAGAAGGAAGTGAATAVGGGAAAAGGGGAALGGGVLGAGAAATGAGVGAGAAATTGSLAAKLAIIGSATLIGGGTAALPVIDAVRERPPAKMQVIVPVPAGGSSPLGPAAAAPTTPSAPAAPPMTPLYDPALNAASSTPTSGASLAPAGAVAAQGLPEVPTTGQASAGLPAGNATSTPGETPPDNPLLMPVDDASEADGASGTADEVSLEDPAEGAGATETPPSDEPAAGADEGEPSGGATPTAPVTEPAPRSAADRVEAALQRARDAIRERAGAGGSGLPGGGGTPGLTSTAPLFPPLLDGLFKRSGVEESAEETPPPSTVAPSGEAELPAP